MNPALTLQQIESASATLLGWIGHSLIFGTTLAALTGLALLFFRRRIPLPVQAALWLVVLVKFVMPVGPAWSYSAASLTHWVPDFFTASRTPPVDTARPRADRTLPLVLVGEALSTPAKAAARRPLPIFTTIAIAYFVGLTCVAGVRIARYRRLVRRVERLPFAGESVRVLTLEVCRRLGVRRAPSVRLSEMAAAPFVFGLLRPTLVLSSRQLARTGELEAVLFHEVAHLRRCDLVVRYVQWLAGTLLFFWPVVAWVNRRIDLAREHACDEWALRCSRLSAGQYARCLLAALRPAGARGNFVLATAMAANPHSVERRIDMILSSTRFSKASIPALAGVALWSLFALTGPAIGADDPAPAQEKEVKVIVHAGEGEAEDVDVDVACDGEGKGVAQKIHLERLDKMLAGFIKDHPTADANADGEVSLGEYHAFVAARAMRDPAAVLEQFPDADLDKNGELVANEAAQLVSGGMLVRSMHSKSADGTQRNIVIRAEVRHEGAAPAKRIAGMGAFGHRNEAAKWVLANIEAEPTVAEVSTMAASIEEASRADFIKHHPEADTDKDGRISDAEMSAFDKQMEEHANALLLKHFPKADTNGDGVLSKDELAAMKTQGNGGVFISKTKSVNVNGQGESTEEEKENVIIMKVDENEGDKQ